MTSLANFTPDQNGFTDFGLTNDESIRLLRDMGSSLKPPASRIVDPTACRGQFLNEIHFLESKPDWEYA